MGDSVERYREGDFVLLGPNLAHFWRSDADFYDTRQGLVSESIVIQFQSTLVDRLLRPFPEFGPLVSVLAQADRGVIFETDSDYSAGYESFLLDICTAPATGQVLFFLQLLHSLSGHPHTRLLAGENYSSRPSDAETNRMGRILDYTILHFRDPVTLAEIAEVAHLSEPAFCRYFQKRTRKTYFTYLNELRMSHARQLLIETSMSISQVALEAGFQNLSYFHRLFRKQTQYSPLHFRRLYGE